MNHDPHTLIKELSRHIGKWPTNSELRATHTNPTNTKNNTHNPDTLPFGLDHTCDTQNHTKTYQGAAHVLEHIRDTWMQYTGTPPHTPTSNDRYANALHTLTQLATLAQEKLPTTTYETTLTQLATLAQHAETQCATGTHPTGLDCHTCGTPLGNPYTGEGLDPNMYCHTCGHTWTPTSYTDYARARITYSTIGENTLVTVTEAALLLGLTKAGIMQRIKRHKITPTRGHGRRAEYLLRDLK